MQESAIPESESRNVSQAAGVIGFYTFLSRILGLVRDIVIAGFFGTGMVADAFVVAFRIPNLLRRLFAEGSLTISFIPVFTEYLATKGKKDAFELARTVMTILALILAVVTLLGIIFSPWIVRLQAFGFGGSGTKYELTVLLTRITFPYIFLISLVAFFMGVLNSLRRFAAPAAAPIFLNVGIIGSACLLSPYFAEPVVGVAIGVLIGGILQVGLQIPWVLKEGVSLVPLWRPAHPAVKRIGALMLPAVFGSAVYQLNQFIGTLLASFLPEGSVAWLYFADRLVQFPLGVFAIAVSTAALPSLSSYAAKKDLHEFGQTLNHALRLVFFITLPSMAGLMVLGEPIIRVLFERGAYNAYSTEMTNYALFFYATGLWAFSGIRVTVAGFYALQDTKTPVKVAAIALVANVLLSLVLMGPLQHGGLALALSLASSIQLLLLLFFLQRKMKIADKHMAATLGGKGILLSLIKCVSATALMGIAVHYARQEWFSTNAGEGLLEIMINLFGLIVLAIFVYFTAALVIRCREVKPIGDILGRLYKKLRL